MPKRTTLDVSLTPELVGLVAARVASGRYCSASEVVRAALRALEHQEAAAETPPTPETVAEIA